MADGTGREADLLVVLAVDANRDGNLDDEFRKHSWVWGPDGVGAIVALDRDTDGFNPRDACPIKLIAEGLPQGTHVHLSIDAVSAGNVTLTRTGSDGTQLPILGAAVPPTERREVSPPFGNGAHDLSLFAHFFPDPGFDGLIQIYAEVLAGNGRQLMLDPIDALLVRVAPWIIPNHLDPPKQLYVCTIEGKDANAELVAALQKVTDEQGLEPLVQFDTGDIWIQDEIEFGYSVLPGGLVRHTCVDGPRDRGLDAAVDRVVATDEVSVYEIDSQRDLRNSLDSFGNLEVSPPVPGHPLGRIVFGTKLPLDRGGRRMQLDVRKFLYAQLLQEPLEIYSDWLAVGHVDEFVCFEPDPDTDHGFRILMPSPRAFKKVLDDLDADGHGNAVMWEGRERVIWISDTEKEYVDAAETVAALRAKDELWAYNATLDRILDGVKDDLVTGLSVRAKDIYEVPCGFKDADDHDGDGKGGAAPGHRKALAYFPDMVNHLVVGPTSIVPRPYGPRIDGKDPLEEAFKAAAGSSRDVRFVDDWLSYHEMSGEVHCGTNTRRQPAYPAEWWKLNPRRATDMSFRQRG